MYIPKYFEITEKDEIFDFIEKNTFGQIISTVKGRLFSNHIPFLISEDKTKIIGHLAKQNPQHIELDDQEVLVTLQGPHDYISPSWYVGSGVPTWNYQAVHIYGHCKIFHDTEKLKSVVDRLSNKHESGFQAPWVPEYNASMLSAIIGIEITINEIQCKYKLSQNQPSQNQLQVIEQLRISGSPALADAMERHLNSISDNHE